MILGIWQPKYKMINKKRIILYYEKLDEIKKTGLIIFYNCDNCDNDKIYKTDSNSLLSSIISNVNKQCCRRCRTKITEYEIKKSRIDFEIIKKSFIKEKYKLLTSREEYLNSENSSQFPLNVICDNKHNYKVSWNNWNNKKRRCRTCYENNKKDNAVKYKDGFKLYKYLVEKESNKNWNKFDSRRRNRKNQMDHIYSIHDGFKNNIPVYIISSIHNLRLISGSKNASKGSRSDMSLTDLYNNVFNQKP